jgi:hypothetical protein
MYISKMWTQNKLRLECAGGHESSAYILNAILSLDDGVFPGRGLWRLSHASILHLLDSSLVSMYVDMRCHV